MFWKLQVRTGGQPVAGCAFPRNFQCFVNPQVTFSPWRYLILGKCPLSTPRSILSGYNLPWCFPGAYPLATRREQERHQRRPIVRLLVSTAWRAPGSKGKHPAFGFAQWKPRAGGITTPRTRFLDRRHYGFLAGCASASCSGRKEGRDDSSMPVSVVDPFPLSFLLRSSDGRRQSAIANGIKCLILYVHTRILGRPLSTRQRRSSRPEIESGCHVHTESSKSVFEGQI
jgi:hypothetical protein